MQPSISHEEKNLSCGDVMKIDLLIEDEKLKDLKFSGNGCAISQAAISILSEEIIGMPLQDVMELSKQDIFDMLGVPVSQRRIKCALLCLLTLKNAINKFKGEKEIKFIDIV